MGTKQLLKAILLFVMLLNKSILFGQEEPSVHTAPTLQLGLNGVTLGKGNLDAQLIMEIVAEKQREIKLKLIENMFLNKLQNSGGTVYSYATNMLKVITEEPNSEIRTKVALENTVNLVFTYAFAEYITKQNNESITKLKNNYGITTESTKNTYLFKKTASDENDCRNYFTSLILDMSSEVIRNNKRLKNLGLMRVSNALSFEALNEYLIAMSDDNKNSFIEKNKLKLLKNNKENIKNTYEYMRNELDKFINIIGIANYFINEYSFNNDLKNSLEKGATDSTNNISIKNSIDTILFKNLKKEIQNTLQNINSKWTLESDQLYTQSIKELQYVQDLLNKVENFQNLENNEEKNNNLEYIQSDILFLLKNQVIPKLSKYTKFNAALNNKINDLKDSLLVYANNLIKNSDIQSMIVSNKNVNFVKLIAMLYDFEKPKTYSDYLNILTELEGVFIDKNINTSLSLLNAYVKNNISIKKNEQGKEYLEFDIESFLIKLSKTNNNKIRNFQFHFTVGVNSISFKNPLLLPDQSSIINYSFVSEKIGFKYKIYNPGAWKPRNIGEEYKTDFGTYTKLTPPKEPLISNVHILAYGSGILYNLTSTGTNKSFNYPIIGFGAGITFYNALDLNVTIGVPIRDNLSFTQNFALNTSFFGLGFDIQFLEYYDRLTEKRKNNQIQKKLAPKN